MATDLSLIDTIVVVMMENRSFDNMLGYLSLPAYGGKKVDGVRDDQHWLASVENPWPYPNGFRYRLGHVFEPRIPDPPHERPNVATQIGARRADGTFSMDGFIENAKGDSMVMNYYWPADIPVTDFLARNFCVCDRWFASLPAGTQPNRLMAMSGYSRIDLNSSAFIPDQYLVYDWLDAHRIRWRVYHQGFFPFASLIPRWWHEVVDNDRFRKFEHFALDIELEPDTSFPQVIFVEPVYTNAPHAAPEGTDDHPPSSVSGGQHFVLDIYRALIANSKRWARTVMILTYDENGGFFDHVSPTAVMTKPPAFEYAVFETTGVRVPAIIISPLVSEAKVHSGLLDHVSILKFIAQKFGDAGHYSPEVDARQVGSVADTLDLSAPRAAIPQPPDASVIPGPSGRVILPAASNNAAAFTRAASGMRLQYGYKLATKFPDGRNVLGV